MKSGKPAGYFTAVAVLLGLHLTLSGHAQPFQLKYYSTKDGLPSPYILTVMQDKTGYLWIGSPNGLSRFDGKSFFTYGLADGLVTVSTGPVFMDSHHRLWVSTRNGIGEIRQNRFVNYPLSDSTHNFVSSGFLETRSGQIWVTTTAGVYRFNSNRWEKVKLYPGYDDRPCRKIIETENGIYINYGDRVVLRDKEGNFKRLTGTHPEPYYYLTMHLFGGELFLPTIEGVYRIVNDRLEKLRSPLADLSGLYVLYRDSKKRFWVGNEKEGLRVLKASDTAHYVTVYKKPLINLISGITEDNQGNIWVCDYDGLVKITEPGYSFYHSDQIGSHNIIRHIIQSDNGALWINDGTAVFRSFSNDRFTEKRILFDQKEFAKDTEFIVDSYCRDDKNRYWFFLRGFRLAMLEGNRLRNVQEKYKRLSEYANDVIFDSTRKKTIAAIGDLLVPCEYADTGFSPMKITNGPDQPATILSLYACANGTLLFSTRKGKIYSIDPRNFCREQLDSGGFTSYTKWFLDDPSGDLWIGQSGRGLGRYSWQDGKLILKEQLDRAAGLTNHFILGMCFDKRNDLWVATFAGVSVFSNRQETGAGGRYRLIRAFRDADLNTEISEASRLSSDRDGHIWLTFPDKLIRFFPEKIAALSIPRPEIVIEKVNLDFKPTDWSGYTDSMGGIFGIPVHPRLPYKKNNIGIYFKAISASGTDEVQYSYQLGGLSDSWTVPASADFVSFINLPPGPYTFRVKAKLPGSDWSGSAVFSFEITKPFWEAWWFRLIVLTFASAIILFLFQYRLRQAKVKNKMKNQLLELEMKALKAQMNPHFIYNALNSIQSLILHDRSREASSYISKFAKLLRQVLENSDQNLISLDRELYSLRLYHDLEKLRLNMALEYTELIGESLHTPAIKVPPLILQPFLENAIWHGVSQKEGNKKITVSVTEENNWIICRITDNGIGRKKAVEQNNLFPEGHLSKAVNITRQRLLDFNQSPGTEPVSFIDLNKEGTPSGTTVIIRIRKQV